MEAGIVIPSTTASHSVFTKQDTYAFRTEKRFGHSVSASSWIDMTTAAAFIHGDNYANGLTGRGLFGPQPVTYSSSQERLHSLGRGDRLWLVSRCPDDRQY